MYRMTGTSARVRQFFISSESRPLWPLRAARRRPPAGITLVWSEEFATDGLPDPATWSYETGLIRNQEAQYYTAGRPENARVENGCLVIEARKEEYAGAHYTSASVNTLGKREFFQGELEVRAKIPTGRGSWPAIWMMGTNVTAVGWPECGEIDVMENVGYEPDTIYATVHTPGSVNDPGRVERGGHIDIPSPFDDFHVYAVEWQDDRLDFYCDGTKYFTYRKNASLPLVLAFRPAVLSAPQPGHRRHLGRRARHRRRHLPAAVYDRLRALLRVGLISPGS